MGASIVSGRQGSNGALISGTGAPSSSVGKDKDYYMDKNSSNLYGPKENGQWPPPIPFGKGAVVNKMDSTGRIPVTSVSSQSVILPVSPNYAEVYLNGVLQSESCFILQDNVMIVNTGQLNATLSDNIEITFQSLVINEGSANEDDISHATLFILGL